MDAGKILYELTYTEGLPTEALKAASAQRAEMVPLFVQEIELSLPSTRKHGPNRHRSSSFSTSSASGGRNPLTGPWRAC